jgi:UDP-N-acetylmuramate dehydrogenase
MNAGGHGSDMATVLTRATVLNLRTAERSYRNSSDLQLGYRSSSIAATEVITEVGISLRVGGKEEGERLLTEVVRWRRENQPGGQNAGSVFINPVGDSAGRLIDLVGARGLRVGTAQVSPKHANFIQADTGGLAADVVRVMREVQERVAETFGVELIRETILVGFDD